MQIDPNTPITRAPSTAATRPPATASASREAAPKFERASELNRAVEQAPVVRPDAVERARVLIGDVKYPPDEAINSIAKLLALRMQPDAGSEPGNNS